MRIASGKVIDGKVVFEGASLDEGEVVTVVAREGDGTFDLSVEEEAELLAAIEEADGGDVVPAVEVNCTRRGRRWPRLTLRAEQPRVRARHALTNAGRRSVVAATS